MSGSAARVQQRRHSAAAAAAAAAAPTLRLPLSQSPAPAASTRPRAPPKVTCAASENPGDHSRAPSPRAPARPPRSASSLRKVSCRSPPARTPAPAMKVERASSVCSDDAPSSPDSVMSAGESSPQPPSPALPLTDPYDDQRLYSPAYSAHSPAYSTTSTTSNSSTGSTGGASPAYSCPASPGYQRPASPDFGFQFTPAPGYPDVEQFGCQAEFVRAVLDGNPRELKRILTRYSQLVQINGFTADGQTALTQSCMDGNLEVIKVLVAHGASLHLANRDGFSPFHLACYRGKHDVMEYLLHSASSRRL